MKKSIIVTFLLLLTACSSIQEGQIDYAKTIGSNSHNTSFVACTPSEHRGSTETESRIGLSRSCHETLYKKYTKSDAIQTTDNVSLHLMQGFIKEFMETKSASERINFTGTNAEIVVLANVCEQGSQGCNLQFGPSSTENARVVYFSNGVREGQYFNFSNLPIYGPIRYKGKPLFIQLTIVELDNIGDNNKALLEQISNFGAKAYPPASAILSLLNTLGQSILSGNQDDILFRYSFELMPDNVDNSAMVPTATLSAGNYVLIKQETSFEKHKLALWNNLYFDALTGRLQEKCSPENDTIYYSSNIEDPTPIGSACHNKNSSNQYYKDYRENTYLTLQVQKGFNEASLNQQQTLAELMVELENAEDSELENILKNGFTKTLKSINQQKNYEKLAKLMHTVSEPYSANPSINEIENKKKQVNLLIDQIDLISKNHDVCKKKPRTQATTKVTVQQGSTTNAPCNEQMAIDINDLTNIKHLFRSYLSKHDIADTVINSALPLTQATTNVNSKKDSLMRKLNKHSDESCNEYAYLAVDKKLHALSKHAKITANEKIAKQEQKDIRYINAMDLVDTYKGMNDMTVKSTVNGCTNSQLVLSEKQKNQMVVRIRTLLNHIINDEKSPITIDNIIALESATFNEAKLKELLK